MHICNIYRTSVLFQSVLLQPLEAALVRTNYKLSEAKDAYLLSVYFEHKNQL